MLHQAFWQQRSVTFALLTLGFGTIYALNNYLTASLMVVPGAHLIHLPSGLKFLLVLVFGTTAACSIFTISFIAGLWIYFPGQWAVSLELALASALAPWLTRKIAVDHFQIQDDLSNLNWKTLVNMAFLFSVINTSTNQLVLFWNQAISNFLEGVSVMFTGDITGVMMVMVLMKIMMKFTRIGR